MKGRNLFIQPSVVVAFFGTLFVSANTTIKDIVDNGFSSENIFELITQVVVVSGVATSRYAEDEDMYTPHKFPGQNKEDLNNNGIPDYLENKIEEDTVTGDW